jgi:hypothetical protein
MHSVTFSQGKLKTEERSLTLQAVQTQIHQAVLMTLLPLFNNFFEQELIAKLGREKGSPRVVTEQPRLIDWQCSGCGCQDANQFIRDGHYQRNLATGWGYLKGVKVPMLECKNCQHDVVANWTIMEKYRRYWFDFTQKALFGSGLCQSLRNMSEEWSAMLGNNVGLSTINQRINQIEVLIQQGQSQPLKDIPEIVQLDGIWISLQTEEDVIILDKKGRQRYHRRGQRKVVLVALGLWSDGSGRREILDWEVATSESEEAWLILLKRLVGRGLTVEGGLKGIIRDGGSGLGEAVVAVYGKAVVDQRCVFHKLKNVKEAISRGQEAEVKRELMGDAKDQSTRSIVAVRQVRRERH